MYTSPVDFEDHVFFLYRPLFSLRLRAETYFPAECTCMQSNLRSALEQPVCYLRGRGAFLRKQPCAFGKCVSVKFCCVFVLL